MGKSEFKNLLSNVSFWKHKKTNNVIDLTRENEQNIYYMNGSGDVRTKTFEHSNFQGSGPIFNPFTVPSFHIDRHTKPSKQEFIDAFAAHCDSILYKQLYLYEKYAEPENPNYQLQLPGRTIFQVKIKPDAELQPNSNKGSYNSRWKWVARLEDIEMIISGEVTWGTKHKKHVRHLLNLRPEDIEALKPRLQKKL